MHSFVCYVVSCSCHCFVTSLCSVLGQQVSNILGDVDEFLSSLTLWWSWRWWSWYYYAERERTKASLGEGALQWQYGQSRLSNKAGLPNDISAPATEWRFFARYRPPCFCSLIVLLWVHALATYLTFVEVDKRRRIQRFNASTEMFKRLEAQAAHDRNYRTKNKNRRRGSRIDSEQKSPRQSSPPRVQRG